MNTFAQLELAIKKAERAHDLDLHGSNLADADLSTLRADRIDLRAVDLLRAKLCAARLSNCRFDGAKLEKADGSGLTLRICVLDGAQGIGARLDGARIEDSSAKGADFTGASLRGTKLTGTSFERAVLRHAVFDDAEGDGVEFRGADLAGASLIGARLDEVDFRGANLQGARLSRGRFRSADFRGALLDGTIFDGADCHGALFDEGAGPHAANASKADDTGDASFDRVAVTAVRELLGTLPAALAASGGPAAELLDRLRRSGGVPGDVAKLRPEDWQPWVERLAKMTTADPPAGLKAFLEALADTPIRLHDNPANRAGASADFLGPLRHAIEALDSAANEPSEEWKPLLELLTKMAHGERPFDVNVLLDQLSTGFQRAPNPAPPAAS